MSVDRSALPLLGPDPVFRFPAIERRALDTGMRVWTVEHRGVPLTTVLLLLPVGAAADPPARPGLAAFVGDLLDEGAGSRSALELHEALARIGGRLDTDVGADATTLTLTVLSRNLEPALEILGDLVLRPRFDPAELERVRERRLHRLVQLRDLAPAVADRAFFHLVYGDHPYGHLAVGNETSLRLVTLDEVCAFHARCYTLARTTLILVGDADGGTMHGVAARVLGSAAGPPGAPVVDAAAIAPPGEPAARVGLVDRPGAAQSEIRIGRVATSRHSPDYHALLVLNMIVGGQFVSRLNLNLREDKGYTYGARTSFDFRRGPGPFVLQMSVATDVTRPAIEEALAELGAVRAERPVQPPELAAAKAALTRGYPRSFETAAQIARACAQLALYELPDDYFTRFVARVQAVGADEVGSAAGQYLDPSGMTVLIDGDRSRTLTEVEDAGLGPVADLPRI
jgi:zinc protease